MCTNFSSSYEVSYHKIIKLFSNVSDRQNYLSTPSGERKKKLPLSLSTRFSAVLDGEVVRLRLQISHFHCWRWMKDRFAETGQGPKYDHQHRFWQKKKEKKNPKHLYYLFRPKYNNTDSGMNWDLFLIIMNGESQVHPFTSSKILVFGFTGRV